MSLSDAALRDVVAQETAEPWLTLVQIDHPELLQPLRFTKDTVETLSNGQIYIPFPFDFVHAADAEGRLVSAKFVIDNTSQEVVAIMRSVDTPPLLTVREVRASQPDLAEKEMSGMRLVSAEYDASSITCVVVASPLESERFPPLRFDRRFPGVYAS